MAAAMISRSRASNVFAHSTDHKSLDQALSAWACNPRSIAISEPHWAMMQEGRVQAYRRERVHTVPGRRGSLLSDVSSLHSHSAEAVLACARSQ